MKINMSGRRGGKMTLVNITVGMKHEASTVLNGNYLHTFSEANKF